MHRILPLLALACSAAPEPLAIDQSGPPIVLDGDGFVLGHRTNVRVSGVRANTTVYLGYSFDGPGAGPCPTGVAGCLGILSPTLIGSITSDADGNASLPLRLPNNLPVSEVWMQAATVGPRSEISNVMNRVFLNSNGDEDGDGVSNGDEADAGMNALVQDSDGAGALDGPEFTIGTDGANPNDDILHDIQTVTVDLVINLDFRGLLASTACSLTGVCDCAVSYQGTGTRSDAWDLTVEFDGTWEQTANNCSPDLEFETALWTPNNGTAFHTATFNADVTELTAWGVAANPGPLSPVADPIAAQQGLLEDLMVPWNRTGPMTFQLVDDSNVQGIDLRSTISNTITVGF